MTEWLGPACALCLCLAALRVRRTLRRERGAPRLSYLAVAQVSGLRSRAGRVEQALNRPGECRAVADPVRGTVRVYCRRPPDGREIRRVLTEQGCSVHALTGV